MKRFCLLLALLALGACANPTANTQNVGAKVDCKTVDYGQGVWYFSCTTDTFANALSQFKLNNPQLIVSAMTGDGTDGYGYDRGYFVSVEPRK